MTVRERRGQGLGKGSPGIETQAWLRRKAGGQVSLTAAQLTASANDS